MPDNLSHRFLYNAVIRNMGKQMFRKGLAVAVILLFIGVALTPTTNADVSKPDSDTISLNEESDEDCGCEDESSPIGWNFPILCTLLIPLVVIGLLIYLQTSQTGFIDFINLIVDTIGCSWA